MTQPSETSETKDFKTRRDRILKQLNEDIRYFQKVSSRKRILYRLAQLFSLGCGLAVPVLVAAKLGDHVIQAIVAAVAAFATASIGIFKLRENWIQYAAAWQMLVTERLAFETEAESEASLSTIIARRKKILQTNLEEWRQTLRQDDQIKPPKSGSVA